MKNMSSSDFARVKQSNLESLMKLSTKNFARGGRTRIVCDTNGVTVEPCSFPGRPVSRQDLAALLFLMTKNMQIKRKWLPWLSEKIIKPPMKKDKKETELYECVITRGVVVAEYPGVGVG